MRKLALLLVTLLFASQAYALTITCTNVGATVTVGYTDANSLDLVRGFALDITATGKTMGAVSALSTDYYIYPGTIVIDAGGTVTDAGTPVAPEDSPGEKDPGITIEMASLYAATDPNHTSPPGTSGSLVSFDMSGADDYTVTVSANTLRGGIVLESGAADAANLPVVLDVPAAPVDCFPSSFTTYPDWVTLGKPDCWCNSANGGTGDYQCDGDVNLDVQTWAKYRVFTNDYFEMMNHWMKKITDVTLNPCADVDHKSQTWAKYRVFTDDYFQMMGNWMKKDVALPGDCGTLARPE